VDGQGTKCRRNIAKNFNCLSRAHERYRQTDGRVTANSEHSSLKTACMCVLQHITASASTRGWYKTATCVRCARRASSTMKTWSATTTQQLPAAQRVSRLRQRATSMTRKMLRCCTAPADTGLDAMDHPEFAVVRHLYLHTADCVPPPPF